MGTLNRREFIESSVGCAVGLSLLPLGQARAEKPPDIVEVTGQSHAAMVKAALDALGGIDKIVRKGDYVVLKPNAAFANPPEWGTTTHPDTVVAVAQLCLAAGAKAVTVVEYPQAKGQKCLDRCGLTAAMAKLPEATVKLLGDAADFKAVTVKAGVALKSTEVAKVVLSADVLINIPAAKAHNATGVALGLKNAMGLIKDRQAFHTLFDIHQGIADLGRVIKPSLTLVDATRVLLTNGPAGPGETATPNRMVAGFNVVSVDAYALTVARFNNKQMTLADASHIELAAKAGLGVADLTKLNVRKVSV
jgi:uncharacterized protein (DUF362 family)